MPGHIPWSVVERTLLATRSIWLATTQPDGRPHAMPIWFTWDGTSVYFITGVRTQKVRNLAQQPSVVVHVGDGDDVIVIEGTAQRVIGDEERQRVDLLHSEKYVDPHSGARDTVLRDSDYLYRVDIERVVTWEYGIVDTRTDWRFAPAAG